MHGERERDRGIEMRARHAGRGVRADHHGEAPAEVDRQIDAVLLAAQHDLRHDGDAKHDQQERAQELGGDFAR